MSTVKQQHITTLRRLKCLQERALTRATVLTEAGLLPLFITLLLANAMLWSTAVSAPQGSNVEQIFCHATNVFTHIVLLQAAHVKWRTTRHIVFESAHATLRSVDLWLAGWLLHPSQSISSTTSPARPTQTGKNNQCSRPQNKPLSCLPTNAQQSTWAAFLPLDVLRFLHKFQALHPILVLHCSTTKQFKQPHGTSGWQST